MSLGLSGASEERAGVLEPQSENSDSGPHSTGLPYSYRKSGRQAGPAALLLQKSDLIQQVSWRARQDSNL
jgi:hypothetical protein